MENNKTNISGGGIGFCGALTLVFIILKLVHKIDWSWFWVLSPLIFSTGLGVIILIVFLIILIVRTKRNKRGF